MRNTPSVYLILLVIGVPGVLALAMLWPQLQDRAFKAAENGATDQPVDQPDSNPASKTESPADLAASEHTDAPEVTPMLPADPLPEVGVATERVADSALTPMPPAGQPSAVEKLVVENREKLDAARASYGRVLNSTDVELLQQFGMEQWNEIQALVSQAQQMPQPLIAVERFGEAEALLRELRLDLPNRQILADLTKLQSQPEQLSFLTKLSEVSDSQPKMRDRLTPFWTEVLNWDARKWMEVVRPECEDLSPEDGGFADVHRVLANMFRELGDEASALDAERVAWDNALRMTNANRAAQSALRSLQLLPASTPTSVRAKQMREVTTLIHDVASIQVRLNLLAQLASMLDQSDAQELYREIVTIIQSNRIGWSNYWPALYRCKVLAEFEPPSTVLDVCVSIPKYNGSIGTDPFAVNSMAYGFAATSAARTKRQSDFWKSVLLAEAQQLDDTGVELKTQLGSLVLAAADLRQKNYRRSVITLMNLTEPALRPSLLFRVILQSPDDVPTNVAIPMIQQSGSNEWGCEAIARYMPTLAPSFESERDAISWILQLKLRSVRVAALVGYARHRANPTAHVGPNRPPNPPVDTTDSRSLLENAEAEAEMLQMPFNRAWAYLWIAACWKTLDQPASYANALAESDDALFAVWKSHWRNADENTRSSSYRSDKERERELNDLIEYYATAAELQAFVLNDPHRAIENVINAARVSQPLNGGNGRLKMRLWLITEAIHHDCGVPPGTLDSVFIPPNSYFQMLLASRKRDLASLKNVVEKIKTHGIGRGYEAPDYLARAYAELALLLAREGDIAGYRSARRKAAGIITSKGSNDSVFLPLYEADAIAGEFSLAINRKRGLSPLAQYGPAARTASTLCIQLSLASRTQDAVKHLPSTSEPFYRLQAMHAVAASRADSTPSDQLVRWQDEQTEQLDRIAILCGLACKKPIR